MKILEQGCRCKNCSQGLKEDLERAREEWRQGKREILFKYYDYECPDRCCSNYGTDVYVNGFRLGCDGDNGDQVVEYLMEFLEVENVEIDCDFGDDYDY